MIEKLTEFFVQKSVPSAYDDSLTWYELISKFQQKLNEIIERIEDGYKAKINEIIKDRNDTIKIKLNTMINDRNSTIVVTLDDDTEAVKAVINYLQTLANDRNTNIKETVNAIRFDEGRRLDGVVSAINTNSERENLNQYKIEKVIKDAHASDIIHIESISSDGTVITLGLSSLVEYFPTDLENINPVSQTSNELGDIETADIYTPEVIGGSIPGIDTNIEELD